MKNIIKLLSILLISSFWIYLASAWYTSTLSIKKLWNESFWDEVNLNSSWDTFVMNISLIPLYDKKTRVDITGLPAWINPNSFAIDGNTCWWDINNIDYNQTSNTLHFTYTPTASSICVITTQYTTAWVAAWNYDIQATLTDSIDNTFWNWNDIISNWNNVKIIISSLVQITEADTIDADNDWYIDWYNLKFNKVPWTALTPAQLSIRTENKVASNLAYDNANNRITFTDGLFTSWDKPLIEVTSTAWGYEKMKYSIEIHNDKAKPIITSFDNLINASDNINVVFNEKMKKAETLLSPDLKYSWSSISITKTYNEVTNTLTINPNGNLVEWWTYTLSITTNAVDWENNNLTARDLTISVIDPTPTPTPSGGWWWGGWGWWSVSRDYESSDYFYNKARKLEDTINSDEKVYWKIKVNKNETWITALTKTNEKIRLYWNSSQESNLYIDQNTSVSYTQNWDWYLYPYLKYDFSDDKIKNQDYLNLNGKKLKLYNADSIWYVWSEKELLSLNKDATVEIKLTRVYSSDSYYVFYSNKLDWEFKPVKNIPFKADPKTWTITIKTDKLWYIVVMRWRYYTWKSVKPADTTTEEETWTITAKFNTLEEARNASLLEIKNPKLSVFIEKYYNDLRLNDRNLEYFTSFDKDLREENNKLINAYYDTFIWLDEYLSGKKDKTFVNNLMKSVTIVEAEKQKRKNLILEKRYVDIVTELDDSIIYRVKQEEFKKAFETLENKLVGKLRLLRDNENIEEEEYQTALSAYNDLVLNFAIYKEFNKLPEALNRAMKAFEILYKTYSKKVVYKPIVIKPQKLFVKDVYSLTKSLKVWDYNDEVKNLQAILRMYGYFDYPSNTWYFWKITRASLIRFSKEVLDYNSTWILTDNLREKILNLEINEKENN